MCPSTQDMSDLDATTSRLLDEAIDLLIRRQGAADNPVTQNTIAVWRARSATHERIWLRVAEAHGLSGAALSRQTRPGGMSRRALMIGGLATLGVGAIAGWGVPRMRVRLLADHITATAEILPMQLSDGTRITLGPNSAIAIPDAPRNVRLLRGMAWFDVPDDADREFVLDVGAGVRAKTSGAAFEVSRDAGLVNLAVGRGAVSVTDRRADTVSVGQWARLDPSTGLMERGMRDPALAGVWQDGFVVAEGEPLDALVARIARWLPGSVVVAGADIARTRVSGLFDMSDPARALAAAVRPTGAHIRRASGVLTIISAL